jgi:hypothetical protein
MTMQKRKQPKPAQSDDKYIRVKKETMASKEAEIKYLNGVINQLNARIGWLQERLNKVTVE